MRGICDAGHSDVLRWHDVYIPSLMKISTDVQAILRFQLSNLNGCNVGIIERKNL
jgi:hypothetical protein